jgi:hypothetical protein
MSEGKKPKRDMYKVMLPLMGLLFAVLLAGMAYGLSPLALKAVGSFNEEWDQKLYATDDPATLQDESQDYDARYRYLFMGIIWLALMGMGMTLVSAASTGTDPEKEAWKQMGAPPANKKAQLKQLKRDLKAAKKRSRQKQKQSKQ